MKVKVRVIITIAIEYARINKVLNVRWVLKILNMAGFSICER